MKYRTFPGTNDFHRPTDPGLFIPTDITIASSTGPTTHATAATDAETTTSTSRSPNASELAQQKARFDERLCLFLEVETVETILRNDLLAAFDDDYMQALRDATDMINLSIPEIMTYLVKMYGMIKPEELREMKKEVKEYIYKPSLPIDVLFNKIDFFADLTDYLKKPLLDADKVDIAYIAVNRCGVFKESLKKWNAKPDTDKTYANLKKFSRDEHLFLDQVDGLTKQDSTLNQATLLQEQQDMLENMEERLRLNLVDAITTFVDAYKDNKTQASLEEELDTTISSALSAITNNSK